MPSLPKSSKKYIFKLLRVFCILKIPNLCVLFHICCIENAANTTCTCVPVRPANLLLDRSSSEVPSVGTVGDWMDGMRTLPCKEAFSGVSYSSCDTLAKTSTE